MPNETPKDAHNLSMAFSDSQLAIIFMHRQNGLEWEAITKRFNKKFGTNKTSEAIRHAHRKYSHVFELDSTETQVKQLQEVFRTRRSNSKTARENRAILEYLSAKDNLLDDIRQVVLQVNKPLIKHFKTFEFNKEKKNMTMELMLSDLHYGKETETFNLEICRRRMCELARTLLAEIERCRPIYNVHRIILALLGDIIESATMHGLESAKGCEFGNPRQVQWAIESLFFDLLLPVAQATAKLGIRIDVPAVTGNHDRSDERKTFHMPGEENLTWIIYNTLKMLCETAGLKNVTFHIPTGAYIDLEIYGNTVLYEHGDNVKAPTRAATEAHLNKRQSQLKKIVHFFRMGHWHELAMFGRGKIIINESLPGPDSYADVNGFDSQAGQTLNFYVETSERPTCFYRSFPIYLK